MNSYNKYINWDSMSKKDAGLKAYDYQYVEMGVVSKL